MNKSDESYIPYRNLVSHLDIRKGDVLYVASNIIKLSKAAIKNEKNFDADQFIESLQHAVGSEGTLLFPAFNFNLKSGQKFDIENSEPITGALSVAVFKRKDFIRTAHPLHSFSVWGKYSDELKKMNNQSSFSLDSPYHFLYAQKAKMLAIDLDLTHSLTFTHYVEEQEQVTYRSWKNYQIYYIDSNGKTEIRKYKLFKKKFGFINDVNPLYTLFLKENASVEKVINGINFKIISLEKSYDILAKDIRGNHAKNICFFSFSRFLRDLIKSVLPVTIF